MEYDVEQLKETPDGLNHAQAGWYTFDRNQTDATLEDLTWNDCGNGPEPTDDGVDGPFTSEADARDFWVREVIECHDGSDAAMGTLTWNEWERETGLTRDEIRSLCPAFSPADFAGCLDADAVIDAYNDRWVAAIAKATGK